MMGDPQTQRISLNDAQQGKVADRKVYLLEDLTDESEQRIILYGEAVVGKTWMAREISNLAKKKGNFHAVIWLFPNNNKYENDALLNSIGRQLSLLRTSASSNVDDFEDSELTIDSPEKLEENIRAELAEKKLLLVLDYVHIEGNVENDESVKQDHIENLIDKVKSLLNPNEKKIKVLITMRCSNPSESLKLPNSVSFKVEPMHEQDATKLLLRRAEIKDIDKRIVGKTSCLPPAIILMAKILSFIPQPASEEELLTILPTAREKSDVVSYFLTELLRNGYTNSLPASVLIDCCWKDNHFFRDRKSVHYNELITHWMLEGYLGPIDFMEKTYERGHDILIELMDCQILKKVESDHVALVKVPIDLDDIVPGLGNNRMGGYGGTANLGLASVFKVGDWTGFGRIFQKDGTMKTVNKSVLLVDGNCLDRAVGGDLFQSVNNPEVLVLINPTYKSWPSTLTEMPNLRILAMRGCDFLHEINLKLHLNFGLLTALEISGSTLLTNLADDFFTKMPKLRSINFSGMQIEKLPQTLYDLDKLSWLILRNCSKLKKLESLKKLKDLMVLDLCSASSLEKLADKNFTQNTNIQTLNLSGTMIKTIPLLNPLKALTHLLLKDCSVLGRLCGIGSASSLQIIDLSMSTGFKEFHDKTLEGLKALKVLDLSETSVVSVPSNMSNLQYVNLKGCKNLGKNLDKNVNTISFLNNVKDIKILDLSGTIFTNLQSISNLNNVRQLLLSSCLLLQELPDLSLLTELEVLDLSDCTALTMIPEKSFQSKPKLQKLDLSKTKIKQLPSISNLSKLLYLSLDGCTALEKIVLNSLEEMNSIQYLNLSETKLKLPSSMLNTTDLRELYLRGCKDIVEVPNLENFTKLEILDLSGSSISQLPSLKNLSKLRQLLLGDCFSLSKFQMEINHLFGAGIADLPYDISTLTQLEQLVLPSKNNTESASSSQAELLNPCDWIISALRVEIRGGGYELLPSISGFRFAQLLETDPSLWKNMYFVAIPLKSSYGSNVLSFKQDNYAFKDIYFKTRHFNVDSSDVKSLEIRGFKCFPAEMEPVMQFAEFVFLIDSTFQPKLSYFKNTKGCWIERCENICQVFDLDGKNQITDLKRGLEVLWVSNTSDLKYICNLSVLPKFIENLTHLHLESCPNLSSVFSTCQPPVNLKVLQIKFCDALETILGQQSEEPVFLLLEILHLWELPKLERIGGKLPSLKHKIIEMCPKLPRELESSDQ
ncbi:putative disease resistance protein At4g19050 [Impatiens glandulifera]|uniref:putative disease resistance protein At4g19050 n=1 Tax=Impatiens glandulifera TaxID=253017 RepID=UPI001FB09A2E|nr:putative disease resistance protein At4g19050 [Impatiens glandulifera]XP_047337897.1 putative disease resistance protein At4g19050 [Impatiens glandulifera]